MKKVFIFSFAMMLICGLNIARADIIYDNGGPTTGLDANGLSSDFTQSYQSFDDFSLKSGSSVITDIHWWGLYYPNLSPQTDNFTIRIYDNVIISGYNTPASTFQPISVQTVSKEIYEYSGYEDYRPIYSYSINVDPISLDPDTIYWLSIIDETPTLPGYRWFWSTTGIAGQFVSVQYNQAVYMYSEDEDELAFYLTNNAVPEPTSFILLATGLGILGLVVRRKK